MKCKNCKRIIQDNSLFCNWCGARQLKEKSDITIPKPQKLKSGYSGQIMVDGERIRVRGKTEAEYRANAAKLKAGEKPAAPALTLEQCLNNYINSNSATLSVATIRGYDQILRCRFKSAMQAPLDVIDWQKTINDEAQKVAPKTVKNAWGLVTAALRYAKQDTPEVNLPAVPIPKTDFLDHKQIKIFLKAIEGDPAECAAILALHSLRASEIYHLTAGDIERNVIHVRGATVRDKANHWTDKDTNKNSRSTRDIPVIIPRLNKLIPSEGRIVTICQTAVREHIEKICINNKLPVVSLHDLRRSFTSLAAYLQWQEENICKVGGWCPGSPIVHKIYIKVSDKAIKEDVKRMKNYLKIT